MHDTVTKLLDYAEGYARAYRGSTYERHAARQALQNELEKLFTPLDIKPPNTEGETMCIVRWMAETPNGWVGAYDRAALEQLSITGETNEQAT